MVPYHQNFMVGKRGSPPQKTYRQNDQPTEERLFGCICRDLMIIKITFQMQEISFVEFYI